MVFAAACGLIVANLYYAQPLTGPIGASLGLAPRWAGIIVTVTQTGYCLGLLLIVPLGDLLENRGLVVWMTRLVAVALLGVALSTRPAPFLAGMWLDGAAVRCGAGTGDIRDPSDTAGHTQARCGHRHEWPHAGNHAGAPVASLVAQVASWRAIFALSALSMLVLARVLNQVLPRHQGTGTQGYGQLLASMAHLFATTRPCSAAPSTMPACLRHSACSGR
ncbi:hypothetical protein RAA17_13280 [Komagataeibacter rhaeticus]|nr:hypothetical protein [Komagataeibacter rhaeticus]